MQVLNLKCDIKRDTKLYVSPFLVGFIGMEPNCSLSSSLKIRIPQLFL